MTPPTGSTRLIFSNWLSAEDTFRPMLMAAIDQFAAANSGIEIENLGIAYDHTEHQLMLMTSSGRAPDLAALIYLWIPIFAHQGALLPLDALYTPEIIQRLYPQSAAAVSFRGQPYAFSWGNSPLVLYANRRLISDYLRTDRLTAENYDELAEWLVLLCERSEGKVIPYSIPFQDDEMLFLYSIYTFLIAFGGGVITEDNEVIFGCGENAQAYVWLRSFIARGKVDISRSHMENRDLFARDRLAFLIEGPWLRSYLPALNPSCSEGCEHLEYSVLPRGPRGTSPSILWNHTLAVFRAVSERRWRSCVHTVPHPGPFRHRDSLPAHRDAPRAQGPDGKQPRLRRRLRARRSPADGERLPDPVLRFTVFHDMRHFLREGVAGDPSWRREHLPDTVHVRGAAGGAFEEVSAST